MIRMIRRRWPKKFRFSKKSPTGHERAEPDWTGSVGKVPFNFWWMFWIGGCLLGFCRGWRTTQFCGDYFINHDIRIPSLNQPVCHGSSLRPFFFSWHFPGKSEGNFTLLQPNQPGLVQDHGPCGKHGPWNWSCHWYESWTETRRCSTSIWGSWSTPDYALATRWWNFKHFFMFTPKNRKGDFWEPNLTVLCEKKLFIGWNLNHQLGKILIQVGPRNTCLISSHTLALPTKARWGVVGLEGGPGWIQKVPTKTRLFAFFLV